MPRITKSPCYNCSIICSLVFSCLAITGCGEQPEIQQYSIPKEVRVENSATEPATQPVAPQGDNLAWFFKLTGPEEGLVDHLKPFTDFLRSLRLENGVPKYDLPEGWTASNGPGMRYQTISIAKTDPPIEVTIIALPASDGDSLEYLRANIDRWRGQLGLSAMDAENWEQTATTSGELIRIPNPDLSMTLVNLSGTTKEFGETRMFTAVVTETPSELANKSMEPAASASASEPLQFKVPEGWEQNAGNAMRLASFGIAGETPEQAVDVSVTRFPGGGGILDNINRWRGQVKLEPITEEQLEETTEKLEIAGKESVLAEINGETTAILVATVPDGEAKWFFKMQGPVESVKKERDRFREFLKSVSFAE